MAEITDLNTRKGVIDYLTKSYQTYYNVNLFEDSECPVVARCDFFEHTQRYFLSRKAELWSADCEEFLYILDIPHLTVEAYQKWRDCVYQDGMGRINIAPGHMYSYITPVFICDHCDQDARRELKKCRIYKSFRFSLYGWMDFHNAVVEVSTRQIDANMGGQQTAKVLKKVLYY